MVLDRAAAELGIGAAFGLGAGAGGSTGQERPLVVLAFCSSEILEELTGAGQHLGQLGHHIKFSGGHLMALDWVWIARLMNWESDSLFAKANWLAAARTPGQQVKLCLDFFGVVDGGRPCRGLVWLGWLVSFGIAGTFNVHLEATARSF